MLFRSDSNEPGMGRRGSRFIDGEVYEGYLVLVGYGAAVGEEEEEEGQGRSRGRGLGLQVGGSAVAHAGSTAVSSGLVA